jgi:hypothetical protein
MGHCMIGVPDEAVLPDRTGPMFGQDREKFCMASATWEPHGPDNLMNTCTLKKHDEAFPHQFGDGDRIIAVWFSEDIESSSKTLTAVLIQRGLTMLEEEALMVSRVTGDPVLCLTQAPPVAEGAIPFTCTQPKHDPEHVHMAATTLGLIVALWYDEETE